VTSKVVQDSCEIVRATGVKAGRLESFWKAAAANGGKPEGCSSDPNPLRYAKSALAATSGEPFGPLWEQEIAGSDRPPRFVGLVALVAAVALAPGFHARVQPIPPAFQRQMVGVSWHAGCPVGLPDLRLLTLTYRGFDGRDHTGRLVANRDAATALVAVFRRLYAAGFPIRRMEPIDRYGGDDFRSIEADNTSAFNCRPATGSSRWSQHAYGRAIDVNPIENPYVSGGRSSHRASRPYLDRARHRPGMAYEGGPLVEAFRSVGWGWGGGWTGIKDYQHFSSTGG
jgi:D-alanyl-D-alanine carboxypeptidase